MKNELNKIEAKTKEIRGLLEEIDLLSKQTDDSYDDEFFKSKDAEIIFYITKCEGETRNKFLGITKRHSLDKGIVKKWYRDLSKLIHPDHCDHPQSTAAFAELQEMHEQMLKPFQKGKGVKR